MTTKTYDSNQVAISIGGHIARGFADGVFCTVSGRGDLYNHIEGIDEDLRVKQNRKVRTVTLNLLQSSATNDFLSTLVAADEANDSGAVPFLLKDNNGTSFFAAQQCWVQNEPDSSFGRESENRTWVLALSKVVGFTGGINVSLV